MVSTYHQTYSTTSTTRMKDLSQTFQLCVSILNLNRAWSCSTQDEFSKGLKSSMCTHEFPSKFLKQWFSNKNNVMIGKPITLFKSSFLLFIFSTHKVNVLKVMFQSRGNEIVELTFWKKTIWNIFGIWNLTLPTKDIVIA